MNPSVTPPACQLPLAREPFLPGIGAKSHLAKGAFGGGGDSGRDFREEGIGKKEEGRGNREEGIGKRE